MKYCDAYQFVSFIIDDYCKGKVEKDITIQASEMNVLISLLWVDNIECKLNYSAFKIVGTENPGILDVDETKFTIKKSFFQNGRRFINCDSKPALMDIIRPKWKQVVENK